MHNYLIRTPASQTVFGSLHVRAHTFVANKNTYNAFIIRIHIVESMYFVNLLNAYNASNTLGFPL